jgi:ribosomal protein L11 methyltransferase
MPSNSSSTVTAALETDEKSARKVSDLIAEGFADDELAVSLVETGPDAWRVIIYFEDTPDEKALRKLVEAAAGSAAAKTLRLERVAAKDWVSESLAGLEPVRAGRFIVHGAHDRTRVPLNRIGIEIEAALAFGTGHHGTTRGCLLALDRLCKNNVHRHPEVRAKRASKGDGPGRHPSRRASSAHLRMTGLKIFDLGTGTGVLAIAAARALRRHVVASDIDGLSVHAARGNARLNRAGPLVEVIKADGVVSLRRRGPFDLIFANILLRPLQRFATPLTKLIAPGGRLILSGILKSQANAITASYHGLVLEHRTDIDGWSTLVLKKAKR